ncbi:hypothetical protein EYF80_013739 [Liparis tanakae]|uniref:Uncharacterized protein n=1 Tax=Liparis tanakae TaxID=230148 RepID=A0A4Z2IDE5_9TELE|nr:hypothetical protein EYF80_013739 [Liparis tanakae]
MNVGDEDAEKLIPSHRSVLSDSLFDQPASLGPRNPIGPLFISGERVRENESKLCRVDEKEPGQRRRSFALTFAVVRGVLLLLIVGAKDLLLRLRGPCRLRGGRRERRGRRGTHRRFLLGLRPVNTTVGHPARPRLNCTEGVRMFDILHKNDPTPPPHPPYLFRKALWRRRSTHKARPHFFFVVKPELNSIGQERGTGGREDSVQQLPLSAVDSRGCNSGGIRQTKP